MQESIATVFYNGRFCGGNPNCQSVAVDKGKVIDAVAEEIADIKDMPEHKAKQEAITFHEANIAIIQKNLSRDMEDLSRTNDVVRRKDFEFRILTAKANIQAEKDLIASLQTGQIVHTRTEWDDYAKDKFIAGIRENQIQMTKAQQQLAEAQRVAALLPPGEAEKAREFIAKQLSPDVIAKADMGKIQQVTNALSKKVEGYYQQAEAQKEIASAERALMVLEGVRTAGGIATSVVFGQTAASVYMGATGYITGGPFRSCEERGVMVFEGRLYGGRGI